MNLRSRNVSNQGYIVYTKTYLTYLMRMRLTSCIFIYLSTVIFRETSINGKSKIKGYFNGHDKHNR